jgi:hypothetical protein
VWYCTRQEHAAALLAATLAAWTAQKPYATAAVAAAAMVAMVVVRQGSEFAAVGVFALSFRRFVGLSPWPSRHGSRAAVTPARPSDLARLQQLIFKFVSHCSPVGDTWLLKGMGARGCADSKLLLPLLQLTSRNSPFLRLYASTVHDL